MSNTCPPPRRIAPIVNNDIILCEAYQGIFDVLYLVVNDDTHVECTTVEPP